MATPYSASLKDEMLAFSFKLGILLDVQAVGDRTLLALLDETGLGATVGCGSAIVAGVRERSLGKVGDWECWGFGTDPKPAPRIAYRGYAEYDSWNVFCGTWAHPEGRLPVGSPVPAGEEQSLWSDVSPRGKATSVKGAGLPPRVMLLPPLVGGWRGAVG